MFDYKLFFVIIVYDFDKWYYMIIIYGKLKFVKDLLKFGIEINLVIKMRIFLFFLDYINK